MKDTKHKIPTLAALTTIAAGVIHLTNRVIVASSQLKECTNLLKKCFYILNMWKMLGTWNGC